ncbi:MAG: ABC transporter permease [Anaerolineae bacterium]
MNDMPLLNVSYRAARVWQRNYDVFIRMWKTELWPPFLEPIMQIVALGLGLGAYVTSINGMSFIQFIAPGFVASGVMFTASFECMFGSYIRMEYQRTFDAIIATPATVEDVIAGEVMWATSRGVFAAIVVLIVMLVFGLVQSPWAILAVGVAAVEGMLFAALAITFTAVVPSIDNFNYLITLGLTPMFLFSGVYFPIENLPPTLQTLAWFSPLTHAVLPIRGLVLGQPGLWMIGDIVWMLVVGGALFITALYLMRRRLIN